MKVVKWLAVGMITIVVVAAGFLFWARSTANAKFARTWDIRPHEIPVPWPLTETEVAELKRARVVANRESAARAVADNGEPPQAETTDSALVAQAELREIPQEELQKLALQRAVSRGQALVDYRLGCRDCHGDDFGGKVVMDAPPVGRLMGPNLTQGQGSVVKGFTTADWERILRHGVNQHGRTSTMPAIDYEGLSDREVSDVIAYVQSYPAVDRALAPGYLGPVLWVSYAFGQILPAAERIDHAYPRPRLPPAAVPTAAYGRHIAKVCRGCHGMDYSGGKIAEGDPSWPPASNLTPHSTGIKDWTQSQFIEAMREGIRPDGSKISTVMPWEIMGKMGDTELEAMYQFFRSLDPLPQGT